MFALSAEFLVVLQTFAPVFSPRVWPYAQALLLGAILAPGKRTVSAVLRVLGLGYLAQFQQYHRVLNRAVWSGRRAAGLLLDLLLQAFAPKGPLLFGLDKTIERRWGRRIEARGIYRDAAGSSKSVTNKTSGLRWLSVHLVAWVPWAGRVWALPFLSVLAPSRRSYQKRHRQPKTLLQRASQLIGQVHRWCRGRELIFVGDATYAALDLLAFAQKLGVTLITTLRLDAALFDPAPPRRPGPRGAPRKKGAAQPKLEQRSRDPKTDWRRQRIDWYGKGQRWVQIATGTAVWYHSGKAPVPIRWVLVRDPRGEFETKALLCADLKRSARQIVECYTWRWQVEVTFEEVRAHLGVETQRQWNVKAIARTTPILLGLFSVVTLLADRLHRRAPAALRARQAAWYAKEAVTFSDALASVRRELWQKGFRLSGKKSDRQKLPAQLWKHFADLLCYAQ